MPSTMRGIGTSKVLLMMTYIIVILLSDNKWKLIGSIIIMLITKIRCNISPYNNFWISHVILNRQPNRRSKIGYHPMPQLESRKILISPEASYTHRQLVTISWRLVVYASKDRKNSWWVCPVVGSFKEWPTLTLRRLQKRRTFKNWCCIS